MSLALFCAAGDRMSWLGIGNVEGVLLRAAQGPKPMAETLLLRGGVVGHSLPPLRASTLTAGRGDLLVLATDGVKPGFARGVTPSDPVQRLAESILGRFGNDKDDGLVLVARYRGA